MSEQKKELNANPDYPDGIFFFPRKANEVEWKFGKLIFYPEDIIDFCKKHPDKLIEYKGRKQLKLDICRKKESTPENPETYAKVDTWVSERAQETVSENSGGADDDMFAL